jgi:hypothetical protein
VSDLVIFDGPGLKTAHERAEQHRRRCIEQRLEHFSRKIANVADETERAVDDCRYLIREAVDVTEELKELECTANGLLLVVALLRREAGGK